MSVTKSKPASALPSAGAAIDNESEALHTRLGHLESRIAEACRDAPAGGSAEALYTDLFESLPDPVIVYGDGKIVYLNNPAVTAFGAAPLDDPRTRASEVLCDPDVCEAVGGLVREVVRNGVPSGPVMVECVRVDGGGVVLEAVTVPLTWRAGPAVLIFMRAAMGRTHDAGGTASDGPPPGPTAEPRGGIWDWNLETGEIYLSRGLKSMLGYARNGLADTVEAWTGLVHPDDAERNEGLLHDHLTGATPVYEADIRLRHADGSYRWVHARGKAVRAADGHARRIAGSHRLVSAALRAEAGEVGAGWESIAMLPFDGASEQDLQSRVDELEAAKAMLERQSAQLKEFADEIARSRDMADAANRTKSEFLANMSHELRTPLNAIMGFSEVIKNQLFGPVGLQQYIDYAGDIYNSGAHLLEIINDILDLSKVEAGKLELAEESIYLKEIAAAVLQLVKSRAEAGGVTLVEHVPLELPNLRADKRKLKQMLLNLLSNGIKFTPEEGTVDLIGYVDEEGRMSLAVRDTGIGVDREHFDLVLTPFGQVDSALAREHQGTGLGLPLVKALIELHGGELRFESELDRGTTVTLLFPAERTIANGDGER